MKIVILTPMFPPKYIGGTEIASYNIAKQLSAKNEVHVITRYQEHKLESGFHTHFVKFIRSPSILKTISTSIGFFLKVRKIRPGVIYAETLFSGGLAGVFSKKFFGIPVISRPVGEIYVAKGVEKLMIKFVIRNSSLVLAMTKHMEREVLKQGRVRTSVLPDGVDYEYFMNFPNKKKIKDSVLFVGRLINLKGVYDLLNAFHLLKQSTPSARLFIAGYGEEEGGMRKTVKEMGIKDVTFLGKVKKEVVAEYMKKCELLVLPSYSEGFPLVLAEAMACGLPIITTNVRGLAEIVKDSENGFLVSPGDFKTLAKKMEFLLKNEKIRNYISEKNIKEAEKYSWENITDGLYKILNKEFHSL